jgi:hypothetical protein
MMAGGLNVGNKKKRGVLSGLHIFLAISGRGEVIAQVLQGCEITEAVASMSAHFMIIFGS